MGAFFSGFVALESVQEVHQSLPQIQGDREKRHFRGDHVPGGAVQLG